MAMLSTDRAATIQLHGLGMRWIVTVCDHVNAAFMQEDAARSHFETTRENVRDLPSTNVKLWRLFGSYDQLVAQLVK